MRLGFLYHQLFVLVQSYLELKMDAPSHDLGSKQHFAAPSYSCRNASFCSIPVRMPNTKEEVSALVSPEDYDKLIDITPVWHVSSSGYVITSKRVDKKNVVRYMHREILGDSGSHVNGDKFDNRRCNLRLSRRNHPRPCEVVEEELIKTVSPLLDHTYTNEDCPGESRHCTIDYENGMVYKGEIHNYRPHGFGRLEEVNKHKISLGWWMQGTFKSGLVMYHAPIPLRLRELGLVPQVKQAVLVVNEVKVDISTSPK
jgi:hypothetical protein